MSVRSAQAITVLFTTRVFATGVGTNADSLPTGTLYLNGTANGAAVTVTNISTGLYKAAVTLPTLAVNDEVEIIIAATVSSVADTAVIWGDTKDVFAGAIPDVIAGGAGGLFIAGTNAATTITTALTTTFTGNLTGSVASVTAGVTLAASAVQAIWDALTSALTTVGSIGKLLVTNIDAAISSRMATYTQPSGFLAATFPPGTIANTTNITAGTMTTVTNLTNAPTSGDFTTTMKTSLNNSTPASITGAVGSVTAGVTITTNNDKTGYNLSAGGIDAIFTAVMTEAYPPLGTSFTMAEALYVLVQHMGESSIVGTTKTVKERDQATIAKTYTLNSATAPTAVTEAS